MNLLHFSIIYALGIISIMSVWWQYREVGDASVHLFPILFRDLTLAP